jgi:fructokinase
MSMVKRPLVVGIGELLWDCFPDSQRPGGAPANVAFHAGQLGLAVALCSRVGCDAAGEELVDFLARRGLDTRLIQRDRDRPTGTVTVALSEPERPAYQIHENVAWDRLEFTAEWGRCAAAAAAICFGTLAQRSARSRATIMSMLDAAGDALRVYDVNLRAPWYSREVIVASLERADVIKLNADEAGELAGMLGLAGGTPAEIGAALRSAYPRALVCITRGGDGCLVISADECAELPGCRVEVVDAVGAGDAFTAALTYGLLAGWSAERSAAFANEVGALVATRAGAMPVLEDELAVRRARFGEAPWSQG